MGWLVAGWSLSSSPLSFLVESRSERPAAVKGAPKRRGGATLDGEDRSETITRGRKELVSYPLHPLEILNSQKKNASVALAWNSVGWKLTMSDGVPRKANQSHSHAPRTTTARAATTPISHFPNLDKRHLESQPMSLRNRPHPTTTSACIAPRGPCRPALGSCRWPAFANEL